MKTPTLTTENRLYHIPLPIIGLTGGIGSGKSSVAKILSDNGFAVIGADNLVKLIYQNRTSQEFIRKNFPTAYENDNINFQTLREIAFSNAENRQALERMIYPQLEAELKNAIQKISPAPEVIFYDVPLLFERGLDNKVDLKVVVYVPRELQRERLIKRDKTPVDLAEKIIDQQWPIERKKSQADYVIDNQGTSEQLVAEVRKFITWLRN